jgi:hypothetical protein
MMEVNGASRRTLRGHKHVPLQAAVEDGRVLLRIGTEPWAEASSQVAREFGELLVRAANQAAEHVAKEASDGTAKTG